MNAIETWLIQELIKEATSPEVKGWVLKQLRTMDAAATNPLVKALIEAAEDFLSAKAA